MALKGQFSIFCTIVPGMRLSVQKLLSEGDIVFSFQKFQMACQVPVSYIQQVFKGIEINILIDDQSRHDAETCPVLERLIQIF